jgi:hypothetical protein
MHGEYNVKYTAVFNTQSIAKIIASVPIPVAAMSKEWFCGC